MENRFFNNSLILGIDHGYGNMKTRNTVFKSGVIASDKLGVNACVLQIRNALCAVSGSVPSDEMIEEYLIAGKTNVSERYLSVMEEVAKKYVKDIFNKLVEYEYNPELMKLYFIGGGGNIIRHFGDYDPERVEIITDICATAKGYENTAYSCLMKKIRQGA